jgi:hypothetical protein
VVMSLLYGHLSSWSWLGVKILCLVLPFGRFMVKEMMILSIIFAKSCPLPKLIPHLPPFQELCPTLAPRVAAGEEGSQHVQISSPTKWPAHLIKVE